MAKGDARMNIGNGFVAGQPIYYPRHRKADGSIVSERATVRVFVNQPSRTRKDGTRSEGDSSVYTITGWGGMAGMIARHCSTGKEISCLTRARSYDALVRNKNGQVIQDVDGSPLTVQKIGFTIIPGTWRPGDDSAKTIAAEIASGHRPEDWDTNPNTTWKAALAARNAAKFVPGSATFGFAKVVVPDGVTVVDENNNPVGAAPAAGQASGFTAPPPPAQTAQPTNEQMLNSLLAANWTPEQIKADPRFAHLYGGQAAGAVPAGNVF